MKTGLVVFAAASLVAGQPLKAQDQVPPVLSLEEALEIARANNPGYRQVRNDIELADWGSGRPMELFCPRQMRAAEVVGKAPENSSLGASHSEIWAFLTSRRITFPIILWV